MAGVRGRGGLVAALLVACHDEPAGWVDDTGFVPGDETGEDTAGPGETWPALDPDPAWTSADEGYGTGLGWADFDGDGDPDLAVAYGNDMQAGRVVVYTNTDGSLEETPSWTSAEDHFHGHLSVGDLDGDGWPDLAVSVFVGDAGLGSYEAPGGVQVFLNDAGALQEHPAWEAEGFYTFSNALGDVDRDGDLDLAVAVGEGYYHDPDLSRVYLNDGLGGFGEEPAWQSDVPRHTFDVAWVDLDEDGWLDLAMANDGSAHTAFLNDGSGALEAVPAWEAPDGGFEGNTVDWGDVDEDGLNDLVVSDNDQRGGAGTVKLYCGVDLALCWESADEPAMQSAVSLADVDGDGHLDLVAGAWWGAVRIYRGDGRVLEAEPSWTSGPDRIVVEAFGWADTDGSDAQPVVVEGEGLVPIPRGRALAVSGGVAGDGYLSGPGAVSATVLPPIACDLAVSDWTRSSGNLLFTREVP